MTRLALRLNNNTREFNDVGESLEEVNHGKCIEVDSQMENNACKRMVVSLPCGLPTFKMEEEVEWWNICDIDEAMDAFYLTR